MNVLSDVFLEAWSRIKPRLDADPLELKARLARRSAKRLTRPFREWCISLRANDRRLHPPSVIATPDHAPASHLPHTLAITRRSLQALCRPVATPPISDALEVAQSLGISPHAMRNAIKRSQFRLHQIQCWVVREFAGRCFRKYPHVSADQLLNPTAGHKLQNPDDLWADFWTLFPDNLPPHFKQQLQRIPLYLPAGNSRKGGIHHLPRATSHSGLSTQHSGLSSFQPHRFWGWQWLCPACNQTCKLIFLPMPFPLPKVIKSYLRKHLKHLHEPAETDTGFACARCHNLQPSLSWPRGRAAWNEVITQVSGGLLYGHEVQIPPHLKRERKRYYKPRKSTPAPKREEVANLLQKGLTYKQIAREMGITYITACWHAQQLMRIHKVKRKRALLEKLRPNQPTPDSQHTRAG